MPLAFNSLSHGTVAFGFYNIETDSLLLEGIFFFCTDFCRALAVLEKNTGVGESSVEMPAWRFASRAEVGDLMGAIRNERHTGYLGEIYLKWPFPADPALFRQKLHGHENRGAVEEILDRRAEPGPVTMKREPGRFSFGEYVFDEAGYRELVNYVWRGGYPTWEGFEDGRSPAFVSDLAGIFPHLG